MKALHDLVESGKVRYIGASNMWTWELVTYQAIAEKHNWTKFVAMQGIYSALVSSNFTSGDPALIGYMLSSVSRRRARNEFFLQGDRCRSYAVVRFERASRWRLMSFVPRDLIALCSLGVWLDRCPSSRSARALTSMPNTSSPSARLTRRSSTGSRKLPSTLVSLQVQTELV